VNSEQYITHLENQLKNSQKSSLKSYLNFLYGKIDTNFSNESCLLEIGSGAGLSKHFLSHKIERTDILPWKQNEVIGMIDAQSLSYETNRFDGAFCVDVIHHLSDPLKAIEELIRVIKPGSKVVLIEPFVSIMSYPIYKLFHSEKTSWKLKLSEFGNVLSDTPSDGDQGVSKSLFNDRSQKIYTKKRLSGICEWNIEYFSPLSFFATGGLSDPLPTPSRLIKAIIAFESILPRFILKLTASRIVIILRKS
jgi:SAM-dependent methyltransferase